MLGSGIGLSLGAAYLAGGMARAATDHQRAFRLAEAAAGGFSEAVLQRNAAALDPGVIQIARRLDPFFSAGAPERDRQSAILTAALDQHAQRSQSTILLKAAFDSPYLPAPAPFHLTGALETSRELECLTQAVYFEARGETAAGQRAVAQVVLNRVRDPSFPKSVCGVVFQGAARSVGCQFSFACDGSMRRGREPSAWSRAQQVAARALTGGVMAAVGNATHFHTTNVDPAWGPRMLRVAQVGLHIFYRSGRGTGPTIYLADNGAVSPYAATQAVAQVMDVPAVVDAPPALAGDLRVASALVVPATGTPSFAMGGPLVGGPEPASAPAESRTPLP